MAAFFLKVQALGVRRLFPNPFPDHHAFTNRDLRHLVYDYIASHHSGNLRAHTGGLGLSTPLSITVITTDKVVLGAECNACARRLFIACSSAVHEVPPPTLSLSHSHSRTHAHTHNTHTNTQSTHTKHAHTHTYTKHTHTHQTHTHGTHTTPQDECRSAEIFRSLTSLTYLTRHPRHQLHLTLHTPAAAQSSAYPEIKVEVLVMETDLRIFGMVSETLLIDGMLLFVSLVRSVLPHPAHRSLPAYILAPDIKPL